MRSVIASRDDLTYINIVIDAWLGTFDVDDLGDAVVTTMGQSDAVGAGPSISDRRILDGDIEATNGVVHVIAGPPVPVDEWPTGRASGAVHRHRLERPPVLVGADLVAGYVHPWVW